MPGSSARIQGDQFNSQYILPADAEEGRRLDRQHEVIKCSAAGRLIMPPVQLGPGDSVIDCGTGTGVWLMDVASRCPETVSFYGIDISPRLFPLPTSTPSNMTFLQHSVLSPPRSFASSFTLINQRLLMSGLQEVDWPGALRVHYDMLRPGGWTQLCEIHLMGFSRPDGARTARMNGLVAALLATRGFDSECALHLASWAHDAGFVRIGSLCTRAPVGTCAGEGPHNYTKSVLGAYLGMKEAMLQSGMVANEQEYEHAARDMEAEWNGMDDAYFPYYWLWGQKPNVTV